MISTIFGAEGAAARIEDSADAETAPAIIDLRKSLRFTVRPFFLSFAVIYPYAPSPPVLRALTNTMRTTMIIAHPPAIHNVSRIVNAGADEETACSLSRMNV